MQNEDILIVKAQAGDRNALNELVSAYWHPIYRFISYKTSSLEDAQELTQETFFRACRSLPNYQQTNATFKTYLSHIALNLIRDFWRKNGRSPALVDFADHQDLVAEDDQPDVVAVTQERREAILLVLQELPDEQRQTVELRIISGLPVKDTALAMNKSEAAIKMLQQRALKSLRVLLLNRGIIENNELGGESNARKIQPT